MRETLKQRAQAAQAKVSGAVGAVQAKAGGELQKLSASVEEITPVLEALGYEVLGARITLGIPPSAGIGVRGLATPVDPVRFEAVLAEHEGNLPVVAVLKALKHIVGVQSGVTIKGLTADMAEITLGTPPSVSLMFERSPGSMLR